MATKLDCDARYLRRDPYQEASHKYSPAISIVNPFTWGDMLRQDILEQELEVEQFINDHKENIRWL